MYRNEVFSFIAIHPYMCGNSYIIPCFIFYVMYFPISFFHVLHSTFLLYFDAKQNLAPAVRQARVELGLSQKKLAKILNIDSRTILNIEAGRGNPKFEKLCPLLTYLKIPTRKYSIRFTKMNLRTFRSSFPKKKTVWSRKLLICSQWFATCLRYYGNKTVQKDIKATNLSALHYLRS